MARALPTPKSRANSGNAVIVVDPRGASASGSVSLIRRDTGTTNRLDVGLHPTAIAVQGDRASAGSTVSSGHSAYQRAAFFS